MEAPRFRMTEAEYLAYDLAHEGKHEFVNGEIVAMAGASEVHSILQGNLYLAIGNRLRGGPCRAHGSDLRVHVDETGLYAYPDITVVCGPPAWAPTTPESLRNPRVLVEVLSPSTAAYDRGTKAPQYRENASVAAVGLVDGRSRSVELQERNPDGTWTLSKVTRGAVRLAALGIEVPVEEIYEGVRFG